MSVDPDGQRRGTIFSRSLFSYPEISDIERAVTELMAVGHARVLSEADYAAFVTCLPKDVLVTGAQAAGRGDIRKLWAKPKFVDYYLDRIPFSAAAQHCGARNFVALDNTRPIEFLRYLYFGKTEIDLKNFALRDLGISGCSGQAVLLRNLHFQRRGATLPRASPSVRIGCCAAFRRTRARDLGMEIGCVGDGSFRRNSTERWTMHF